MRLISVLSKSVLLFALILNACSDSSVTLDSIEVSPQGETIAINTTLQLKATVIFSDGKNVDMTGLVLWKTSDEAIAKVDSAGLVTALASGQVTITAEHDGKEGTTLLTVSEASLTSIDLTPKNETIAAGTTVQLAATGTFSDSTTQDLTSMATWESQNEAIATIDSEGLVTGLSVGKATIRASYNGISALVDVEVTDATLKTISIDPITSTIALGTTVELKATGTFSDDSTQDLTESVTWTSADENIATVSEKGIVEGIAKGTLKIKAEMKGISSEADVTVTDAELKTIVVTPADPSLAKGTSVQLVATGTYSDQSTQDLTKQVTWTSSDATIVAVSNVQDMEGEAKALAVGSATLSAALGQISGDVSVTVTDAVLTALDITPSAPSLAKGTKQTLVATGTYSDGSKQDVSTDVTWESDNETVAAVSNAPGVEGEVSALETGSASISATLGTISQSVSVTVTDAILSSINITPVDPNLAKGAKVQLSAFGVYSDGSKQDLTTDATWSSSDASIASASNTTKGEVSGVAVGSAIIKATFSGVSGTTNIAVTAATLDSISITPTNPSIAYGTSFQFSATGLYSDGTSQDLTEQVSWISSDTNVAKINSTTPNIGYASGIAPGQTTISASLNNVSGSTLLVVTSATLSSISIDPASKTLAVGGEQYFKATGTFSDQTTQDITKEVTWSSSKETIATISNANGQEGHAVTLATGTTVIAAVLLGKQGSATLAVTPAVIKTISVTPTDPTVAKGSTQQFTATATYSDSTTEDITTLATWTSSEMTIASISNAGGSEGLASALGTGSTTITASYNNISGSTTLNVSAAVLNSIAITPNNSTIAKGTTVQLTATGTYSDSTTQDLTDQVTWTSADSQYVTVSSASPTKGLATGVSETTGVNITAALNGISGSATVVVTAATLSNIVISPANTSAAKGTTVYFTAEGQYSDGNKQDITDVVNWSSSNDQIATISNTEAGRADALTQGIVTISAALGGKTANAQLTVTPATLKSISVTPSAPSIAAGTKEQFMATGTYSDNTTQDLTNQVTWTSSNPSVAVISNAESSRGQATGVAAGTSTISATISGITGSATLTVTAAVLVAIEVSPATSSIPNGQTQQMTATGSYSDGSTQNITAGVTWTSSDEAIATVSNASNKGMVETLTPGTTTITATLNGVSGDTSLTVTPAVLQSITVTPTNPSLAKGTKVQLTATGTFSDGTSKDLTTSVTWSSDDSAVASVNTASGSEGLVQGLNQGTATISASSGGISGATDVTVTAATLSSVAITPTSPTIAVGTTISLTATGTYSDGSTQNVTTLVTWASDDEQVATVSNATGSKGLATGLAQGGPIQISATLDGKTATASLVVSAATLSSIQVTPVTKVVAAGLSIQYNASGTYSDGSTQDITTLVTWASSDKNVATILNTLGYEGLAKGQADGTTTISASLSGKVGNATLTVTPATLVTIDITPTAPSIAKGANLQFAATGHYSDGSSENITNSVVWSSSNTSVATISNAVGTEGMAVSLAAGTTDISATLSGKNASTTLTVTAAVLTNIEVSPTNPTVALGVAKQFKAIGTYSDFTTQDLTDQVTWDSSVKSVAEVSNAAPTEGLASTLAVGDTEISATLDGVSGSSLLTVTPATLQTIVITPDAPTIANGTMQIFTATALYSDGSSADVTEQVSWSSTNYSVAFISNAIGSKGQVTATGVGTASINATLSGVIGTTTITVTAATLTNINVAPSTASAAKGTTVQFTATGLYSDGSSQDLTEQVGWQSSDQGVATVSNLAGERGLASAIAQGGPIVISATFGSVIGTANFTVTAATLLSIDITPANASIDNGESQQFAATGNFSDGSSQDITTSVTWSSTNSPVATISNASGSEGLATSVSPGTTTIGASFQGQSGTTSLTVRLPN